MRALRDMPGLEAEASRLNEENRRLSGDVKDLRRSQAERRQEDEARRSWSGTVPLVVFSAPSRGEPYMKTICVSVGQPEVLLAVLPPLAEGTPGEARYHLDVRREGGAGVWSLAMTAEEIRGRLKESGVVAFLIPAASLPSARYVLAVTPEAGAPPILTADFVVAREGDPGSQCQSPAATNAPP